MKYIWIVALCTSFILLGCQSEKEEVAQPQPKVQISTENEAEAAKAATAAANAAAAVTPVAIIGDAINGKSLARRCKGCHSFDAGGRQMTGPNLFGLYGKTAGKVAGFSKYSSDLRNATFVWDDASLAAWMCKSKEAIKTLTGNAAAKTKMANQRKCDTKGQDIAAYLRSLK
jgi:cytochrome c2